MIADRHPFPAVLLCCDQRHYEATVGDDRFVLTGKAANCSLCGQPLRIVKVVTISPVIEEGR